MPSCQQGKKPKVNDEAGKREHRRNGVEAVKRTPEYRACEMLRMKGAPITAPRTPDPSDLTIPKRAWERTIMDWRNALREGCASNSEEPIEEF